MWNIKVAEAYPLRNFHKKICRACTPFQDALAGEISLDLLKGLWMGVDGVWLSQNFQRPLARNYASDPKVLEVQERARGPLSPFQVWWGSDFTRRRDGQKR